MSIFKEIVEADTSTFINPDEFGEMKRIKYPGHPPSDVRAVESDDVRDSHKDQGERYRHFDEGAYQSRKVLFVREKELGFVPVEDDLFDFGDPEEKGYPYRVAKVNRDMGILEIHIEANRT